MCIRVSYVYREAWAVYEMKCFMVYALIYLLVITSHSTLAEAGLQ